MPVRNDARNLRVCLGSILAEDPDRTRIEIIVADNGSTDPSADVARNAGARVLVLPGMKVAELRNRAAREAQGRRLAFVDADHRLGAGWLEAATRAMAQPGVVAAGAPYLPPENGTWVQRTYDGLRCHADDTADVEWLASGNLVVDRSAFRAVGGFDTSLETCEDVDLCQRLRAAGGRVVQDARMRSTHFGDPATLKALFVGELWRGRDNLRASLRSALTLRALPSVVIPVATLLFLIGAGIGLVLAPVGGAWLFVPAAAGIGALAGLRAAVILSRLGRFTASNAARALAVALTYDVARALAPVWVSPQAARRRAEAR